MPVDDHPVHERTKIDTETFRYGCFNRKEYATGYFVLTRVPDEHAVQIEGASSQAYVLRSEWVPYRMSRDCATARTGQAATDPICSGCVWIDRTVD